MKFLIDIDPLYAGAYKIMAREMGYKSRQELIEYILMVQMDAYPHFIQMARPDVAVKQAIDHHEMDFVPHITVHAKDLEWARQMLDGPIEEVKEPKLISLESFMEEKGLEPMVDELNGLTDGVKLVDPTDDMPTPEDFDMNKGIEYRYVSEDPELPEL